MAKLATGSDPLTPRERSARMAKVRGRGNRSTEQAVAAVLIAEGIDGWTEHPPEVLGRPDFYFPTLRLTLFVDGCFWHGCPKCDRNLPRTRSDFWRQKIEGNRMRDRRVQRQLWKRGFHVLRVWEHEVAEETWLPRLRRMLSRLNRDRRALPHPE